jgi:hypothetical protein
MKAASTVLLLKVMSDILEERDEAFCRLRTTNKLGFININLIIKD